MLNTINSPTTNPGRNIEMWSYPAGATESEANAAVITDDSSRLTEEYLQHQYAERVLSDGVYADRDGNGIDPAHAEDALRQAAEAVEQASAEVSNAYGTVPVAEQFYTPEQNRAASSHAQIYAPRIEDMRDHHLSLAESFN